MLALPCFKLPFIIFPISMNVDEASKCVRIRLGNVGSFYDRDCSFNLKIICEFDVQGKGALTLATFAAEMLATATNDMV
jgi:hypothetical protein